MSKFLKKGNPHNNGMQGQGQQLNYPNMNNQPFNSTYNFHAPQPYQNPSNPQPQFNRTQFISPNQPPLGNTQFVPTNNAQFGPAGKNAAVRYLAPILNTGQHNLSKPNNPQDYNALHMPYNARNEQTGYFNPSTNTSQFSNQFPTNTNAFGGFGHEYGHNHPLLPQMRLDVCGISTCPKSNFSPLQQQNPNPFYQPQMNTTEFAFHNNFTGEMGLDSSRQPLSLPQRATQTNFLSAIDPDQTIVEKKLLSLAKMYETRLISEDEYFAKKKQIVKRTLDSL